LEVDKINGVSANIMLGSKSVHVEQVDTDIIIDEFKLMEIQLGQ
jgi:hypothetical protein